MIVDQRGGDCISQTFRGKLFSELKLVTDNLLFIYYFVTQLTAKPCLSLLSPLPMHSTCIVHMYTK